jgi:predicted DsbA family dithiol-disulfide isomerase
MIAMGPSFAVTYDYRCPFARNAHEHLALALKHGAPYDVEFWPFSLVQVHLEEGAPSVWDDPAQAPGRLAQEVSVVVRDRFPERFLDVHVALFAARHDEAQDLQERGVVAAILERHGLDPEVVFTAVDDGWPREACRKAHEQAVSEHQVFGVPTFVTDQRAVFVRLMHRPAGDAALARRTIDQLLELIVDHPELNEFKATTIPR